MAVGLNAGTSSSALDGRGGPSADRRAARALSPGLLGRQPPLRAIRVNPVSAVPSPCGSSGNGFTESVNDVNSYLSVEWAAPGKYHSGRVTGSFG